MNYSKVATNPNTEQLIDISDYVDDVYTSSVLFCLQHRTYQKAIRSSSQELINESKCLIAHAEELISTYKTMYRLSN